MATLHYASGNVGNQGLDPAAAAAGFNLADVGDAETLKSLSNGVKALYYLDEAKGVTPSFVAQMNAIKGDPDLFAVYLADEPYPAQVKASDLKAESDWIHANMPGVKTFIVADNMGSNQDPNFNNYYTQANTHIDLWGLDPYPVRSEMATLDYTEIGRTIAAAKSQIGISSSQIVPVFQAFGGVDDGDNGEWVLPTPAQEKAIIAEFAKFVPNPAFDYAYSWMKQDGDTPLSESSALQAVFKAHNAGTDTTGAALGGVNTGNTGETYTGTDGDDQHAGTSHNDKISGRPGNDVLRGRDGNDKVTGDDGKDNMNGSDGNDVVVGGSGDDALRGGAGDDQLAGGLGNDNLFGGSGNDTFLFDTKLDPHNRDRIVDFSPKDDTIALDKHVFNVPQAGQHLDANAFKDIASQAQDSDDRILYDHKNGNLYYDADGKGGHAPVQFATLSNHPHLTEADFLVV